MDIRKSWLINQPIAHRGLHNDEFPENSLGSFENAIKHNFAIELDVRTIDDGNIIVFHDDKLGRLTSSDGYVCNLKTENLAEIKLDKSEEFIPTFEEVLTLVAGRTPILIEIKNQGKVGIMEQKLIDMLKTYDGEFAVQSFNPYSMGYFKEHAPQILRGQLSSFLKDSDLSRIKKYLLKRLRLNNVSKPDFISYDITNLPNKYVTKAKLPVLAWTVKSNSEMEAIREHCDNIIFERFIPEL